MALLTMLASNHAGASERVVVDLPLPARTDTILAAPAVAAPRESKVSLSARPEGVTASPALQLAIPVAPGPSETPGQVREATADVSRVQFTLGKGQSLYEQFEAHGLDRSALVVMVRQDRRIKKALRRLWPGQRVQVTTRDGRIQDLLMQRPGPTDLLISRTTDDRFQMQEVSDREFASADVAMAPEPEPTSEPTLLPREVESPRTGAENETTATNAGAAPSADIAASITPTDADGARSDVIPELADSNLVSNPMALHRVTVQRGDSLFLIFRRLGISPQDLARLLAADKQAQRLKSLRPGQEIALGLTHDKRLHSVSVDLDDERTLSARRSDTDDYTVQVTRHPLERRVSTASAVIENSLFLAGQRAGLSDRVIMELTEIFGWDVDFALDVRAGDRFTVIHEELYKDGEKVRDGPILASEFVNRGRSVRAIRFVDDTGRSTYYSPDGLSMRKAFLRTPVRFSRISSRFSSGRMHPVLQRMRAHKGVDYAAPTGTPINATGDGRVVFAGRKGGYGRTVILQHGSTYTTLYAHMSRLHRRAKPGARVRQGDTIGYVGKSGLATGPHLHYEFRVRGRHADPLSVKLPKALPIEARYKAAFQRASRPLVSQLDTLAKTSLASSD